MVLGAKLRSVGSGVKDLPQEGGRRVQCQDLSSFPLTKVRQGESKRSASVPLANTRSHRRHHQEERKEAMWEDPASQEGTTEKPL